MNHNIKSIYTPLELARKEIWKRWNDRALQKKVEEISEDGLPSLFHDGPKAVLARNIASPNMELLHFLDLAQSITLPPRILEYTLDTFTPKNQEKYFLGKLFFYRGRGRKGGARLSTSRLIDFNASQGRRLSEIRTTGGETLPDFHHRILRRVLPGVEKCTVDMSRWVLGHGKKASEFYEQYLLFFVCHGILFENFVLQYEEKAFTQNIVIPAIARLESQLGVKPLIVPLCPFANEDDPYWKYYPGETRSLVHGEPAHVGRRIRNFTPHTAETYWTLPPRARGLFASSAAPLPGVTGAGHRTFPRPVDLGPCVPLPPQSLNPLAFCTRQENRWTG